MRAVGKLEAKVAHEESVPLAEKIITKSIKKKRIDSTFSDLKVFKTIGKNKMTSTSTSSKLFLLGSFELGVSYFTINNHFLGGNYSRETNFICV